MYPVCKFQKRDARQDVYDVYNDTRRQACPLSALSKTSQTPDCCWQSAAWHCAAAQLSTAVCCPFPPVYPSFLPTQHGNDTPLPGHLLESLPSPPERCSNCNIQACVRVNTQDLVWFRSSVWQNTVWEKRKVSSFNGLSQKSKQSELSLWGSRFKETC